MLTRPILALLMLSMLAGQIPGQRPAPASHTAQLRVLDRNGGPVARCRLTLLRWLPQSGSFGKVEGFESRELGQRDFVGDTATITGLPAGEFVFQVEAELHAMARSTPFRIGDDGPAPEVIVHLTRGAVLSGTVLGADGKPLPGATVGTEAPSAFAARTDVMKVFAQFIPTTLTLATTTTDAEGRFELPHLIAGKYRVVARHPDFCEHGMEVELAVDQKAALGHLKLQRGTQIEGTVTFDGKAEAGLIVQVTRPATDGKPEAVLLGRGVTDAQGRYRIDLRLPPGRYQVSAWKPAREGNPFQQLLQMKQTERNIEIEPGQDRKQQDFAIAGG